MTAISGTISDFFSWWSGELADLPIFAAPRPKAGPIIEIDGDRARLVVPASPENEWIGLPQLLSDLAKSKASQAVTIRFPHRAAFSRTVMLPTAASRNFAQILALDLERATPFKREEVYSGHTIMPTPLGSTKQSVRHAVIKRHLVDRARADIETAGLHLTSVECNDPDGGAPLLIEHRPGAQASIGNARVLKTLAACLVVLAASLAYLTVQRHEHALAELQAEIATLKPDVQAMREQLALLDEAAAAAASFNALRQAEVSRAAIMEELTRLLPDQAWLTELKVRGASVDIAGVAASASALLPLIEQSPYFVDAQSTTPVTLDPQNRERFGIRMRLRNVVVAEQTTEPDAQETLATGAIPMEVE